MAFLACALLISSSCIAQTGELSNSVGVAYSAIRFEPHDQYLGVSVNYRFLHRSWIGFEVQATQFTEYQLTYDAIAALEVGQADAVALIGHRFGKVALLTEGGAGVMRSTAFVGYNPQGSAIFQTRSYPDILIGGLLDVRLARHWSLVYEVRDNMLFVQQYTEIGIPAPNSFYPAEILNVPEGRVGVSFHF